MQTVVETEYYASRVKKLLLPTERDLVIQTIAFNPLKGDIIERTGGVRKLRFATGNKGKSGGARVIYYYYSEIAPIYLFDIYSKNEKANVSKAERNAMALMARAIKQAMKDNDYD